MWLEPWLNAALAGIFGLLIGSFLNVVIYRLPQILERQWAAEAADYAADLGAAPAGAAPAPEVFNLWMPRSRCQSCGHQLRAHENIPVLSYLFLRGRCSSCTAPISARYPVIELVTAALFFLCVQRWGATPTGLAWCGFSAVLVTLAMIDWDTTLLPDNLTLPLLWAGLLASALQWIQAPLFDSVIGAAAGYLSLWTVYWGFKLATGKEGMGFGDFKLYAALGAWFGWQALVPLILLASVVGAVVGIAMKFSSGLREGGYIPFGPFLVGAGLIAMVFGPQAVLNTILGALGL
ncbi:prepilin peptidase [Simplicispira psychrophila]|uniref:prepilin peptidase n=1 Tax=Simplicispira psychrophila TaxID=80882 RepID=UPI000489400B|nr:A24 family peptidase [Simplicispira psychrophila]